jgi:hypothetical protein
MRIRAGLIIIGAALLLAACSVRQIQDRSYYLLSYYPHTENPKLVQKTPIDAIVCVETAEVARPYDRRQVAIRGYGPELQYSDLALWAENFGDAAPRLISQRLQNYNVFREIRPVGSDLVNLRVMIMINNVEFFRNPDTRQAQAHLDLEISLVEADGGKTIVRYANSSESGMLAYDDNSLFVQQINLMLLQETDRFIVRVLQNYGMMRETPEDLTLPETTQGPSLIQDTTATQQKGILEVPALSMTENEPYYHIVDQYGLESDIQPRMGQAVLLDPGTYAIRYGSGNHDQQMEMGNVEIVPMFRTRVEPDWGCLIVDIVDERRNYIQMQYDVFDGISGTDYGIGWSVEDEIGKQERVWVLKPGLYKITINDEPANTYRNFSTVVVEKGRMEHLMLVVDTDEEGNPTNLIGSGVSAALGDTGVNRAYKLSSAIHANLNLTSNNETDKSNPVTSLSVTTQLDNRIVWDQDPYYFNSKALLDASLNKEEDTGFRVTDDQCSLRNTFIYYVIKDLGLYTRLDATSQLWSDHLYTTDPLNYMLIDRDSVEAIHMGRDEIVVSPNFMPLNLKEGVGLNLRLFNRPNISVNLRSGFGMRQDINNEVFVKDNTWTDPGTGIQYEVYRELDNLSNNGIEFSAVSTFQLGSVTLSSNADALKPMGKNKTGSYEWENTLTLKLIKYISLDYRYNLKYNKEVADYATYAHKLYLRFTYLLY